MELQPSVLFTLKHKSENRAWFSPSPSFFQAVETAADNSSLMYKEFYYANLARYDRSSDS